MPSLKKEQLRRRSCFDRVLPRRGIIEKLEHSASRRREITENLRKAADQKEDESVRSFEMSRRS